MNARNVVERFNWTIHGNRGVRRRPGSVVQSLFDDPDRAAIDASRWEQLARSAFNPFGCNGPNLFDQSSLDPPRFNDWLLDHNIEPPGLGLASKAWAKWWAESELSGAEQSAVWEALDRVRFYRHRAVPIGVPMYLVAHPQVDERDYLGCRPAYLANGEALADEICAELYEHHRSELGLYRDPDAPRNWSREHTILQSGLDSGQPNHPTNHVERRELELHGRSPHSGGSAYVVVCRHWRTDWESPGRHWWPQDVGVGEPLASYANLEAAYAEMARLEVEARADSTNPFRFGAAHGWTSLHPAEVWERLSQLGKINFNRNANFRRVDNLWCAWWDRIAPTLSCTQIAEVWAIFDKLRFHDVVTVEYRDGS